MKVYVNENDKFMPVKALSEEIQAAIANAVRSVLSEQQASEDVFEKEIYTALADRVCNLEDLISIEYLPEKLTFFTFNNLRCQQDGITSEVKRFEKIEDAIKEYNSLPKEYTTALGGYLSETNCIDFVHRRNGENVLVTDYRNMDNWANNGLVKQAISKLVDCLGVEYESDIRSLGTYCPILVPFSRQEEINSYYKDKFLYPKSSNRLLSAINEVYEEGEGWVKFEDFYHKVDNLSPSKETYRPKVTKFNINYIDQKGRCGQADVSPRDFLFLKEMTLEKQKTRALDAQISSAEAKKVDFPIKNSPEEPTL